MAVADSADFAPPRYSVVREIARSSRTRLFEAMDVHPRLRDRRVALKVLRRSEHLDWFFRVARTTASLCHRNIVPLYEVGDFQGAKYFAIEFVPGTSLMQELTREPRWSVAEAVRIVCDVSAALDCAHAQQIVHGRLHPKKILLTPDHVPRLIGFGEYPLPADCLVGNPIHLAPEQLLGDAAATPQTDVYSLSESIFWMLSGTHPYKTENAMQLMEAKKTGPTQSLGELRPDLSSRIDAVLRKGMSPKSEDRFQSAKAFAEALAESSG